MIFKITLIVIHVILYYMYMHTEKGYYTYKGPNFYFRPRSPTRSTSKTGWGHGAPQAHRLFTFHAIHTAVT
jgi:hypothetical protein